MLADAMVDTSQAGFITPGHILVITLLVVEVTWLLPNLASFWSGQLGHAWEAFRMSEAGHTGESRYRCETFFCWYRWIIRCIMWVLWFQIACLLLLPVFVFIVVPPIRKWIINSIISVNPRHLPFALWCLAWVARIGGDVATGNNIAVWVMNWAGPDFYPFWAPLTLYYAVADTLNCLAGALIGTGVLVALKRSGIRIKAFDLMKSKITGQKG